MISYKKILNEDDEMNNKDRRLIIVLLSMSFMVMISGTFFPLFFKYVWPKIVPFVIYGAGSSMIFLVYFIMFAFIGAAIGLMINSYTNKAFKRMQVFYKKMTTFNPVRKSDKPETD